MSRDASKALMVAVKAALIATPAISTKVGTRIEANWSTVLDVPFIRLSVPNVRPWEDDCGEGSEHTLRVHVFADLVTATDLAAAVREALQDADLTIAGTDLRWLDYDQTIKQPDPDNPNLYMAIVAFKAVTTASE